MSGLEKSLLAVSLDEAVRSLENAGYRVQIQYTGATCETPGQGGERVVRLRLRDDTGIIAVTCELTRQGPDRLCHKPFRPTE